jgi:hypothetical protein
MGRVGPIAVFCSLVLGIVTTADAQGPPAGSASSPDSAMVDLSRDQVRALDKWLSAMDKWQQYDARWDNRPVHDTWGRVVARRPPPEPPDWLEARCAAAAAATDVEFDERSKKACRLLADPRARTESVPAPVQAARMEAEKPPSHTSFWTRVHLDGLWTTSPSGARFYGIVGSHVSLVDVGRLQIFGPPGVMLLSVPDGAGSRRITLGYTWGVSLRLADVRLFAPTKNMTLFLNVSKVWLDAGDDQDKLRGFDIAGFSLAPRKKR